MGKRKGGRTINHAAKRFKANPDDNKPGAIISFDKNKQRICYKECFALFHEYLEKQSPDQEETHEETTTDIASAIQAELDELKTKTKGPSITSKDLGANCVGYLQIDDPSGDFSSVEFFRSIYKDIKASQRARTRFLHRLIPIETVCVATLGAINEKLEPMLQPLLGKGVEAKTFAVEFKCRNNSAVTREDIHTIVLGTVCRPHYVSLTNPQVTVVVQVTNTWCGLSIIENISDFGKAFSIRSLTPNEEEKTEEKEKNKKIQEIPQQDEEEASVSTKETTSNEKLDKEVNEDK